MVYFGPQMTEWRNDRRLYSTGIRQTDRYHRCWHSLPTMIDCNAGLPPLTVTVRRLCPRSIQSSHNSWHLYTWPAVGAQGYILNHWARWYKSQSVTLNTLVHTGSVWRDRRRSPLLVGKNAQTRDSYRTHQLTNTVTLQQSLSTMAAGIVHGAWQPVFTMFVWTQTAVWKRSCPLA